VNNSPFFSICIPAYNRAKFLPELLDSIFMQSFMDYEVVICEDKSPQRADIAAIVSRYETQFPGRIRYHENAENLGYDANLRALIDAANGRYCFFMGNDDVLTAGALEAAHGAINRHPDVGVLIRSYGWFKTDAAKAEGIVRYFAEERFFPAGADTIGTFFRRVGVLSGFVVARDNARAAATSQFDGYLYYQMYLAASVLACSNGVFTPELLTMSRDTETPDFGNSRVEKKVFQPGSYSFSARIHMISGMLTIAKTVERESGAVVYKKIEKDIANYVYPYIRDQLNLGFWDFFRFYYTLCKMGFLKYPLFHIIIFLAYSLKKNRFDAFVSRIRAHLGRTPRLGSLYGGIKP
jgi:glycosyltransferase involved in cell wall biosynthesis